jgi:hypothetical protein
VNQVYQSWMLSIGLLAMHVKDYLNNEPFLYRKLPVVFLSHIIIFIRSASWRVSLKLLVYVSKVKRPDRQAWPVSFYRLENLSCFSFQMGLLICCQSIKVQLFSPYHLQAFSAPITL